MASAKVHHVKSARKANKDLGIKIGQEYWWWKFNFGAKQVSLTDPGKETMVRLTEHEANMQDFELRLSTLETCEYYESWGADKEELSSDIENAKSELEDKLQNLPEQFQESHMLNDRISELEHLLMQTEELEEPEKPEEDGEN